MIATGIRERGKNLPFRNWIRWNLKLKILNEEKPWKETFALCLWWLWRWRNDEVFNAHKVSLERKWKTVHAYSLEVTVGKNGFEHNNLAIFELKLHWVPQIFFGGSTWECVLLHEEMNIIY